MSNPEPESCSVGAGYAGVDVDSTTGSDDGEDSELEDGGEELELLELEEEFDTLIFS
jgi:hypothetical protein